MGFWNDRRIQPVVVETKDEKTGEVTHRAVTQLTETPAPDLATLHAKIEGAFEILNKQGLNALELSVSPIREMTDGTRAFFLESHAFGEQSQDRKQRFYKTTFAVIKEMMVNRKDRETGAVIPTKTLVGNGMNNYKAPAKPEVKTGEKAETPGEDKAKKPSTKSKA